MNTIKLAIVDDHQIIIDGMCAMFTQWPQIQVVITANNGKELLALLHQTTVDIVLTDVAMPIMNGQQLATEISQTFPHIKVIALSMDGAGEIVENMIEHGNIQGYLLKQTGGAELVNAIELVYQGKQYFQSAVLENLGVVVQNKQQMDDAQLTTREIEIIRLMESDLSNKQMAEQLFISVRTVETHRKNIFRKTGTNNVLSLVKWAYKHKIL